jgi:hypothetical protein
VFLALVLPEHEYCLIVFVTIIGNEDEWKKTPGEGLAHNR